MTINSDPRTNWAQIEKECMDIDNGLAMEGLGTISIGEDENDNIWIGPATPSWRWWHACSRRETRDKAALNSVKAILKRTSCSSNSLSLMVL